MYGMDISHWQEKIDLSIGNYDFCILKATEGIGYTDPSFAYNAVKLTKLGKLIGCYHYARPDLNDTKDRMKDEAKYFVNVIRGRGLLHKAILILDWERKPYNSTLISTWLDTVYLMTGCTPFIYGGVNKLDMWKTENFMKNRPLWVASYKNRFKEFNVGQEISKEEMEQDIPWKILQYTNMGQYPYYAGYVDLDYTTMTKEEWLKYAGEDYDDTEDKKPPVDELSTDMKWAINMGLFVGYGDGKYGPKDPLTREQAASVLHKFYDIIVKEK